MLFEIYLVNVSMGGRYHQKYKSFRWFRQNIVGSRVGYEIAHVQTLINWYSQSTNCLAFFAGKKRINGNSLAKT